MKTALAITGLTIIIAIIARNRAFFVFALRIYKFKTLNLSTKLKRIYILNPELEPDSKYVIPDFFIVIFETGNFVFDHFIP